MASWFGGRKSLKGEWIPLLARSGASGATALAVSAAGANLLEAQRGCHVALALSLTAAGDEAPPLRGAAGVPTAPPADDAVVAWAFSTPVGLPRRLSNFFEVGAPNSSARAAGLGGR